jgi:hypothetical protein
MPIEDEELARRLPDEARPRPRSCAATATPAVGAVDELSERCQALLRIVAFEHRPDYTEIASDLGMPVGSIGPPAAAACRSCAPSSRTGRPMAELTDDDLLAGIRTYWEARDPVPDGMVARLQAAAALAASDTDLDIELMLLVERTEELAGARGTSTAAYTLRFAHDGVDLLLRVSTTAAARASTAGWSRRRRSPCRAARHRPGWSETATSRSATPAASSSRPDPGMLRLRLEPTDGSTSFMTPAFEI